MIELGVISRLRPIRQSSVLSREQCPRVYTNTDRTQEARQASKAGIGIMTKPPLHAISFFVLLQLSDKTVVLVILDIC